MPTSGRRQSRRVMFAPEEEVMADQEPLQSAGSQNNLLETDTAAAATVVKATNIRKTRVNFMNGHHMVRIDTNGAERGIIDINFGRIV